MYIFNGQPFDITLPQLLNDVQYPPGWFFDADQRAANGIVEVPDPVAPATTSTQIATLVEFQLINGTWTPRWSVRDATPDEIAAAAARAAADEAAAIAAREADVQTFLDDTAWLYGYDSLLSAISYANEPSVPAFQVEGQAFSAWRSLVWAKCRDVEAQYKAGSIAAPTSADLIAELPALGLPAPTLGRTLPR